MKRPCVTDVCATQAALCFPGGWVGGARKEKKRPGSEQCHPDHSVLLKARHPLKHLSALRKQEKRERRRNKQEEAGWGGGGRRWQGGGRAVLV